MLPGQGEQTDLRGTVRWGRVEKKGNVIYLWGRKGVTAVAPATITYCQWETFRKRGREKKAKRTPPPPHRLPRPITHTGLRGWMERRAPIGRTGARGGVRVTATQLRLQERGMHEKFCLTLSVEKDTSTEAPCVKTSDTSWSHKADTHNEGQFSKIVAKLSFLFSASDPLGSENKYFVWNC